MTQIKPQAGPQTTFLSTPADIAFYGGAAGGGKTFALLMEPLRHIMTVDGFGGVIFRRLGTQISNEGGLWDESMSMYAPLGAQSRESYRDWLFPPYNNRLKFAHLQYSADVQGWQGSQIAFIGFDELTHFQRAQFFYMFSRNRSTCGVRPYIRGTYNPVPPDDPIGGWIHEFVSWYLDDRGYPIPERSGVIRWFVVSHNQLHWSGNQSELQEKIPSLNPQIIYICFCPFDR